MIDFPRPGRAAARPSRTGRTGPPLFVSKSELAYHLRCSTQTVDARAARGELPPPWAWGGRSAPLWRRDHFDAFVATGRFPWQAYRHDAGDDPGPTPSEGEAGPSPRG